MFDKSIVYTLFFAALGLSYTSTRKHKQPFL
jgi:hypothetical protein